MLNEDDGTSGGTGDVSRDPGADRAADAIRIYGKIGTDPEELRRWADHVVAGKPIEHMEIADLRSLIEAVQAHPEARLAPGREQDSGLLTEDDRRSLTRLEVRGGRVARGECHLLDIRVTIAAKTTFHPGCRFMRTTFRGDAIFEDAVFMGFVVYDNASFLGQASFLGASFESGGSFGGATFEMIAWLSYTTFGGKVSFWATDFRGETSFTGARLINGASFRGAAFAGDVSFEHVLSTSEMSMLDAFFEKGVIGDLRTVDVSEAHAALIDTRRRHSPWVVMGTAGQRESYTEWVARARREYPWERHDPMPSLLRRIVRTFVRPVVVLCELWEIHRENHAFWRVLRQMFRERLVHGAVGWNLVRALGRLSILNRVSLVALIAVPVLAAGYIAAQKIVVESEGEQVPIWIRWMARAIGGSPHLSETLALAFFASVLVTLGLLVYQTFAPDTIKQRDEDEHVRDLETRYSDENPSLRGDGLRRSIERLEDQAKVRPNRHPRFVRHHGDTIWIPPRDKPEWFRDDDLVDEEFWKREREAIRRQREGNGLYSDDQAIEEALAANRVSPPMRRAGFVPAAERARICIEEGARAEYWLKAHEKIGWAWVSLVCYLLGIAILLVILFIQCRSVAKAAWWPENTTVRGIG